MQAVILCGGRGTRISDMHPSIPKALVPVNGKPFIDWQVEWLAANGINSIHLAAGHLAGKLEEWRRKQTYGPAVTLSTEPKPLGTGGGLKFCQPFIKDKPFFIINGDTLAPALKLQEMMLTRKKQTGTPALIAVTRTENADRYGTLEIDSTNIIQGFHEKAHSSNGWINGGVYLACHALLDTIRQNENISLETQIFPEKVREKSLVAFRFNPPLLDMGTPAGLQEMEKYLTIHPTFNTDR